MPLTFLKYHLEALFIPTRYYCRMASTFLYVEQHENGLAISADLPGEGRFVVEIIPGEPFGGRIFEEWESIASSQGYISADWLEV